MRNNFFLQESFLINQPFPYHFQFVKSTVFQTKKVSFTVKEKSSPVNFQSFVLLPFLFKNPDLVELKRI
jgi:hypothetical protein